MFIPYSVSNMMYNRKETIVFVVICVTFDFVAKEADKVDEQAETRYFVIQVHFSITHDNRSYHRKEKEV